MSEIPGDAGADGDNAVGPSPGSNFPIDAATTEDASGEDPIGAGDATAGEVDPAAARCGACADYAAPTLLASVGEAALIELSGATVSWKNSGVIFVHNDGGRADIYALGLGGAALGRFVLTGARVVDLEDMGVGPCPLGTCLYLADIGDNEAVRPDVVIFRITEPELPPGLSPEDMSVPFERFTVTYEDGAHNAEGILIDPRSGAAYIVTKPPPGEPSAVYRLPHPLSAGAVNVATKVTTLPIPTAGDKQATGAAAHPCGRGFLVRTYNTVYEFRVPADAPFETAFAVPPVRLPAEIERQSEAVSYMADGRGFITAGEVAATPPIYYSACAP